jgi:hypothetical protein
MRLAWLGCTARASVWALPPPHPQRRAGRTRAPSALPRARGNAARRQAQRLCCAEGRGIARLRYGQSHPLRLEANERLWWCASIGCAARPKRERKGARRKANAACSGRRHAGLGRAQPPGMSDAQRYGSSPYLRWVSYQVAAGEGLPTWGPGAVAPARGFGGRRRPPRGQPVRPARALLPGVSACARTNQEHEAPASPPLNAAPAATLH